MTQTKSGSRRYRSIVIAALAALGAAGSAAVALAGPVQSGFSWMSSAPLITPPLDPAQKLHGVKDPSIVYHDGKYHVFMTTAGEKAPVPPGVPVAIARAASSPPP